MTCQMIARFFGETVETIASLPVEHINALAAFVAVEMQYNRATRANEKNTWKLVFGMVVITLIAIAIQYIRYS